MTRRKNLLVLLIGAVLIAAPIGVLALRTDPAPAIKTQPITINPAGINPKDVYTFDCELTEQKPESFTQTCADGGIYIYDITWKTWSATGAEGTGTYSRNLCDPSCAEGKRVEAPVNLKLFNLIKYKGKIYLKQLEVTPSNPSQIPAELNPEGWDVSEFPVMMDW